MSPPSRPTPFIKAGWSTLGGSALVPEHTIDDEAIDDPGLRAWFDGMRDRHNAEEKAEETGPREDSSSTPHHPSWGSPNAPGRN